MGSFTEEKLSRLTLCKFKKSSSRYYPTRLATTLTSGTNAALTKTTSQNTSSLIGGEDVATEQGFIILETNYKLYAYTDSPLQIAVLNQFCDLKSRYANMITAVLSRESIRRALGNGITAEQIISYLNSHAHPQMRRRLPKLPVTVIDQIRLWELERNRITTVDGYLYQQFKSEKDYKKCLNYAKQIGVLQWFNPNKKMFFVSEDGHEKVRDFWKSNFQKKSGGSSAGTPSHVMID